MNGHRPTAAMVLPAALGVIAPLHAGDGGVQRFEYTAVIMAVEARISVFCDDEQAAAAAAKAAFDRMNALNDVMSDYIADSELMSLSRSRPGNPVHVSDDLFGVLERATQLSLASEGAFDVTAGPLTELWRTARRTQTLPGTDALTAARARVGWRSLDLDRATQTVTLRHDQMQLDLGGIGKGFAVDEAMKVLRDRGLDRCLVRLAGDIAAGLPPPGKAAWMIAIELGEDAGHAKHDVQAVVPLCNQAISTSGDAEQHVEIGGIRYSHIIDPRTGMALTQRQTVTVIAQDATTSDALATAICVLGPERGARMIEQFPGASFQMRSHCDGELVEVRSDGFPASPPAGEPPLGPSDR